MARVWGREMNYTATIQDPPHTSQSSSACTKSLAPRGLTGSPVPQTAEQLVEAPNVMSLIGVIRHPVEQTVGGGRIGGLPGFLPGQSYSLSAEQIVDNPVLVSVVVLVEVFMVYTQDRVQRFMEQIIVFLQRLPSRTLTFQLRVVRLAIFIKILFLQLVLQICWKRQIKGFFRTFPGRKKVRRSRAPRGQNWARTSAHGLRELSWWVAGWLRH